MKRNAHLQPLSRQHHNGLLMALLLHKGIKKNAAIGILSDFILKGWEVELKDHFEQEENFLLPMLQATTFDQDLTDQLIKEHEQIRNLINKIADQQADPSTIEAFATALEKHIRFEERTYFPKAEKILSAKQLEEIGNHLHEDNSINCINYPVKFWE